MIGSRGSRVVPAVFACALMAGVASARIWHANEDSPQVLGMESTSWTEVKSQRS